LPEGFITIALLLFDLIKKAPLPPTPLSYNSKK